MSLCIAQKRPLRLEKAAVSEWRRICLPIARGLPLDRHCFHVLTLHCFIMLRTSGAGA
jgi:hypothetical protein